MSRPPAKVFNGPAQKHVSRLKHLEKLLDNLPKSLPENPPDSRYRFGLNPDDLKDGGYWQALNRNLECCFETHKLDGKPLVFTECGENLRKLVSTLKTTIFWLQDHDQRALIHTAWLDRLVKAAEASGAKIP